MSSEDIGVSEAGSSPVGHSLQLGGTGTTYSDFAWKVSAPNTFDACNTGQTFSSGSTETPPTVNGTTPADTASDVAIDANIDINFSEDVTVSNDPGPWFDITCTSSSGHTAGVTGGLQNFTLNPDSNFTKGETCTVTVTAANVTDVDSDDPPDNMAADYVFSFTVVSDTPPPPVVSISEIQTPTDGSDASPYAGQAVTTTGMVIAVFYNGYFIEELAGGPWSGLWVFDSGNTPTVGNLLQLTGTVDEYYGLTELIMGETGYQVMPGAPPPPPAPAVVTTAGANNEQWESVLVRVENVTVSNQDLGHGEWSVNDGSGDVIVDDKGSYTYPPANGDALVSITGPLDYAYGAFKIQPRDDNDILLPVPPAALVINEVDYDQPGTDTAEFIEIRNNSDASVNLSAFTVELINGNNDSVYRTISLPNEELTAGDYYVICSRNNVINCDMNLDVDNLIQNGAPDAVALLQNEEVVDAVSYEGDVAAPYVEDSGAGLADNVGVDFAGISRFPDGADTNQNNIDFSLRCITPGKANSSDAGGCEPPATEACGDAITPIYAIQGDGAESPLAGQPVSTEGIVTSLLTNSGGGASGFFMQDPTGDENAATSDGIYVYAPDTTVAVDDAVRVAGVATEYNGLTKIGNTSLILACGTGAVPPVAVDLPGNLEPYEGMLVVFPEPLTAGQNYFQGRYGQVTLSSEGRLFNPTNLFTPGSPEAVDLAAGNLRRMIVLDDGTTAQNPSPIPYIGADNTLRAGDTVAGLTGVVDYGPISSGSNPNYHYRLQPTSEVNFSRVNERTPAPDAVGGTLKVASFNVLNYFSTLDGNGPLCGPLSDQGCRGADSAAEFTRQRDKIISAILAIDADVVGLMEIENHPTDAAIQDLVSGLNDAAGAPVYNYLATGPLGLDVIRVAFIYKPATVELGGNFAILDSSVDPRFNDDKNRPALAQTFKEKATGEAVTVVVNHLKSKGSSCEDIGDPDLGDGQGNCNLTRQRAAEAMADWLATNPTNSSNANALIIGDLNSYAREDPITALKNAGYTNLPELFMGAEAYSYIFDGQAGYLDHALASPDLLPQVAGVTDWHINTDEPSIIDYNLDYKTQDLYSATPYRASDHDPVIIGLVLAPPVPQCNGVDATIYVDKNGKVVGGPRNGRTHKRYLIGTFGDDVIVGTNGKDIILGLFGTDLICGRAGKDVISGGVGNDTLFGGSGKDNLRGDFGNDTLFGEDGKDTLNGGFGRKDVCDGGEGRDRAIRCESKSNIP